MKDHHGNVIPPPRHAKAQITRMKGYIGKGAKNAGPDPYEFPSWADHHAGNTSRSDGEPMKTVM